MEHIFVINPAAGACDPTDMIEAAIARSLSSLNCEIYRTTAPGDATAFVAEKCSQSSEPLRFYACGGDGSLNEVVNGAVNHQNVSVGCFPCGSGNDFVKYYGGAAGFMDIDNLINGEEHPIDLIKANGKYCINVLNFGFDTAVVKTMQKVKTNRLFAGKRSYFAGVAMALINSMRTPCKVSVDGEVISSGDMLLCTISNGRYVGSSFQCAPRSENNDGLLEVCLVKPLSRITFIKLVKYYTRGEHLDNPKFKDYIVYRRGTKIKIDGGEGFSIAIDGELVDTGSVDVEVIHNALNFIVPRGINVETKSPVLANNS